MELILNKIPKNVTIIEGFPGFGLVGTITTEFLVNSLKTEEIGQILIDKSTPMVAIHNFGLIKPITIHYAKKENLIIIHSINPGRKIEVPIALAIKDIMKKTKAKQLISIEGVMNQANPSEKTYFHTSSKTLQAKLQKKSLVRLKEGLVAGVTAALMARNVSPMVSLFAEVHSQLPDSRAAARIIKCLDSYLGLKIDTKPLMKQATEFENKIKGLLDKSSEMEKIQNKDINYFG